MWHKTCLLSICLFALNLSGLLVECGAAITGCKNIADHSVDLRLKTYLFCDYDSSLRPQTSKEKRTEVGLIVMPKMIEFDEQASVFSLHCWLPMNWTDPHLTWNSEDFNGTYSLYLKSSDMWIPDIAVLNAGDFEQDTYGIPITDCALTSDGVVRCVPAMKISTYCVADYTNYPYDLQNCSIDFASSSYSSDEVFLGVLHGIVYNGYSLNNDWKIVSSRVNVRLESFKMESKLNSSIYSVRFILQRRSNSFHILYITPAIVLMLMTLTVLWLDCESTERMVVACLGFICHLICIQDLFMTVPYNGAVLPSILRFYEKSFLLMSFSLLLTMVLRQIRALSRPAPNWITFGASFVLKSKVGQLLLLSILDPKASAFLEKSADDNDDLVQADKKSSTWNYLTLLLGWIAFVVVFFTYLVLLALFMPSAKSHFST